MTEDESYLLHGLLIFFFWNFLPNFILFECNSEGYGFLSVNLSSSAVLSQCRAHNTLRHLTP